MFNMWKKLYNGEDIVALTKRGIAGIIAASNERADGKFEQSGSELSIVVHKSCRKEYTRPTSIEAAKRKQLEERKDESKRSSQVSLRSSVPAFDFRRNCLFCGEEASQEKEKKKEVKYRKVINTVTTLTFKDSVKQRCDERQDELGRLVQARVDSVHDLVAAEARYHRVCDQSFFTALKPKSGRGRKDDKAKGEAFQNLIEYMENSDECQFLLDDLVNRMARGSSSQTYGRQYLKDKLKDQYGDAILITEIPGKSSIVNFKGRADQILMEYWDSERESSMDSERLKFVETAAKVVRDDIRKMVYDCEKYPAADIRSIMKDILPESLKVFLRTVISSRRNPQSQTMERKRTAIGHAIVSASRPRSFVPPILLGLGVYVHRHYASKQLIQLLGSFGFSVPMSEVHRYEYSVLCVERPQATNAEYTQFCFDNADFNIRTLDGKNTFHCMGGIMCTSPASEIGAPAIPRVSEVPKASDIANMGKFDIYWYRKPFRSGLKSITVKDLGAEVTAPVVSAMIMDNLWLCGKWAGCESPPSWNGYMKASFSSHENFHTTDIEALPFINLEPSNPSTIYSALKFAAAHCQNIGQKFCFVTFDQPLYAKGAEIVASDTSRELENVIVRLGGFHLLMSYLGAIGYVMSGSGIEELWTEVYAKLTVPHMLSGHAYSR